MKLLIFKTNIGSKTKLKAVQSVFSRLETIKRWTVDMEDVDNVLRIEAVEPLEEHHVIDLIKARGLQCEVLTY